MSSTTVYRINLHTLAEERRDPVRTAMRALEQALYGSLSSPEALALAPAPTPAPVPEPVAPVTAGRIWRVSDGHSMGLSTAIPDEAIATNSFGLYITPNKDSKNERSNPKMSLQDGTEVPVSRSKFRAAEGISKGDTLYLADTHNNIVYKGLVLGCTTDKPFSPTSMPNSFGARTRLRAMQSGKEKAVNKMVPLASEVEMNWQVKWERFALLTETLRQTLRISYQPTVVPLSGHPSVNA